MHLIKTDNLDSLSDVNKWRFTDIDVVFCCLGTRVKEGEEVFVKVDKTYPLLIADIAKNSSKVSSLHRYQALFIGFVDGKQSEFLVPLSKDQRRGGKGHEK